MAEGLAAHRAHIGTLACVRAPVAQELRVAHKSFAAVGADKRFLPRVHTLGPVQLRAAAEGLAAVRAGVGLLAGVRAPVVCQAQAAHDEGPLAAVYVPVPLQARRGQEGFATFGACMQPCACMDLKVLRQVRALAEGPAVVRAGMGLRPGCTRCSRKLEFQLKALRHSGHLQDFSPICQCCTSIVVQTLPHSLHQQAGSLGSGKELSTSRSSQMLLGPAQSLPQSVGSSSPLGASRSSASVRASVGSFQASRSPDAACSFSLQHNPGNIAFPWSHLQGPLSWGLNLAFVI